MSDASTRASLARRRQADADAAQKARRRNTLVLFLVAFGVMIAATAAFVVPMLITP